MWTETQRLVSPLPAVFGSVVQWLISVPRIPLGSCEMSGINCKINRAVSLRCLKVTGFAILIHTYIHTYLIARPQGFAESNLHYTIKTYVHDNDKKIKVKKI